MSVYDFRGSSCHSDYEKRLQELGQTIGYSPGYVSSRLRITRQAVYELAKAGYLEMFRLFPGRLQIRASEIYVSEESIIKYEEMKAQGLIKPGRK